LFPSLAIALEHEYRAAGVPMLPAIAGARRTADAVVANTALLVAVSLALAAFVGWPYLALAAPAGAGYLACTLWLRREPTTARAWRAFKLSGLYLLALLGGLALAALA
jgi:protoheme IX farnesyltransferase